MSREPSDPITGSFNLRSELSLRGRLCAPVPGASDTCSFLNEMLPSVLWGRETASRTAGQHEEAASHHARWAAMVLTCRAPRAAERRGPRGKDGLRKGDKRTEPADHLGGNDELGFGWAGK